MIEKEHKRGDEQLPPENAFESAYVCIYRADLLYAGKYLVHVEGCGKLAGFSNHRLEDKILVYSPKSWNA